MTPLLQEGQFRGASYIGIPNQYLTQFWISSASSCSSSADIGGVVNQAPSLGAKRECNRFLSCTFIACDRRSLSDYWSNFSWVFFWILLSTSCNPTRQFALTSFSRVGFIPIRASTVDETDSTELIKAARCWTLEHLKPNPRNLMSKFACFQLLHVTFHLINVSMQSLCALSKWSLILVIEGLGLTLRREYSMLGVGHL